MIRACAAVGGCNTASTLSRRWISCCRRAGFGVLMDPPAASAGCGFAVEGDNDIGDEMDAARALVAGPGADLAGQRGDRLAAGRLAESGFPGAVLGEQRRHAVVPAAVEAEAVFGQHLANGVFF